MTIALRPLFKNASTLFFGGLSTAFLSFLQGIIVARSLGPASYGFFGVVITTTTLLKSFLSFRIEESLTKYIVTYREQGRPDLIHGLILTSMILDILPSILVTITIFLLVPTLSKITPNFYNEGSVYFLYSFVGLFLSLDVVWSCLVRDDRKFRLLISVPFVFGVAQTFSLYFIYSAKMLDVFTLCYLYLTFAFFKFFYSLIYIIKYLRVNSVHLAIKPNLKVVFNFYLLKDFWDFSKSTFVASSFSSLIKNADMVLLSWFRGESDVGYFRLAKNLASITQIFISSMVTATYRDFVDFANRDLNELIPFLKKVSLLLAFIVLPLTLIFSLTAEYFIIKFYGFNYRGSVILFKIMLLGHAYLTILFWVQPLILARGLHQIYKKVVVCGTLVLLVVTLILSYFYGSIGSAISNVTMMIFFTTTYLIILVNKLKKS